MAAAERENIEKTQHYQIEERHIREENLRLQRKLQLEVERREELCRHLSESESSLEMEEERIFNENVGNARTRTISSPVPTHSPSSSSSRPLSPTRSHYCARCGSQLLVSVHLNWSKFNNFLTQLFALKQGRRERFIKPAIPLPNLGLNTSAPNVLSSSAIPSHHSSSHSQFINNNNVNSGSNVSLSSLNNSIGSNTSSSTLPSQSSSNISAFIQPPSPMMD